MKYLFKYHFKGKDLVTVEGVNQNDEIVKFSLQRYVSACDAYWRIAEFEVMKIKLRVSGFEQPLWL